MVCRPKRSGGLGIKNCKTQNEALLMKYLHKFYNKFDTPWVNLLWSYYDDTVPHAANLCGSFWWRDVMKLVGAYRSITTVKVSIGDNALFWSDTWHSDGLLQSQFPRLHSFALDQNL